MPVRALKPLYSESGQALTTTPRRSFMQRVQRYRCSLTWSLRNQSQTSQHQLRPSVYQELMVSLCHPCPKRINTYRHPPRCNWKVSQARVTIEDRSGGIDKRQTTYVPFERSSFNSLLNNTLGTISKGEVNRMMYKNFEENITRKHGILIEAWPLQSFENPSAIGSQVELNVLLRAWQTGATWFRRMAEDEYMAWVEKRANLATSSADFLPTIQPPEVHNPDASPTPPTNLPVLPSSFNISSFESAAILEISNSAAKKPRKTRSDKGKPRKKASQIPGASVFNASPQ